MTSLNDVARLSTVRRRSARSTLKQAWHGTSAYRPVLALVIILFVVFTIKTSEFTSGQNLQNLLLGVAVLWVVALGMTFSLISGGVDISVGALVALDGFFLAKMTHTGAPQWVALLAVLVFGALVGGLVNGVLIGRFRLSFFVVTLASMTALTGVVNIWSGTNSEVVNSPFVTNFVSNSFLGLRDPIWLMIVVFVIALYMQRHTYLGRDIYATGGSEQAARLSGVNTTRTLIIVYAIVGLGAAIGSVISVAQIGVASPQVDPNLPLDAIAAALLGGSALGGGAGGVEGTVFGTLFIGILANGLSLSGVSSFWQQILTGIILIGAVLGNQSGARRGQIKRLLRREGAASGTPAAETMGAMLETDDTREVGMPQGEGRP